MAERYAFAVSLGLKGLSALPPRLRIDFDGTGGKVGEMPMMDWSGWAWWWMAIPMVVFWGAVAWVIVMVARRPSGFSRRDARDVLDERYARGEIDSEEYRTRRETLRG
jgi:putative membrane protein